MKRKIILLVSLVVLVALGWYAVTLIKKRGHSNESFVDFTFEIKDTARIDRVIITEPNGAEMELIRTGKVWTDKNGGCVQQLQVGNILDAAYNAHFKGYVAENALKGVTNRLATQGVKVQFFVDGDWSKTWYIGTSTPDHAGTFMLLETSENGRSDEPVIAELTNMNGIIGPRFYSDPRKWQCTNVFSYNISDISSVDVKFSEKTHRNFTVTTNGNKFEVTNRGKKLIGVAETRISKYLSNYKRINYELPNYELTDRQIDSVKKSTPYCTLVLKTKKGDVKKLKMYRRKSDTGEEDTNDLGETVSYDINRFWCVLPSGEMVKAQYFVFDKITRGDIYFGYEK